MLARRRLVPALVLVATVSATMWGGTGSGVALALLSLPFLAWAFDNNMGVLLPLSCLFLPAIGVMVVLIALLALPRG